MGKICEPICPTAINAVGCANLIMSPMVVVYTAVQIFAMNAMAITGLDVLIVKMLDASIAIVVVRSTINYSYARNQWQG